MKYYLIAGEASGDLHGSNLMKQIKASDSKAEFRFWGGDLMQEQDKNLLVHYRETAFMGLSDVLLNINTIRRFLKKCKEDILHFNPDALIFIDYPGFNLRIAKFAKQNKFKTHYYISPKVWAWNTGRALKIKRDIDFLYTILPFETAFYAKFNMKVDYVGNPLCDSISNYDFNTNFKADQQISRPYIALLPGSRMSELKHVLPTMLKTIKNFPEFDFILAGANHIPNNIYESYCAGYPVKIVKGLTYDVLKNANAALVCSGTATLETALLNCPQVVVFRFSKLSYFIGKLLIKVKYISLVNLILNKPVLEELIQDEFNESKIVSALSKILNGPKRLEMIQSYAALKIKVGNSGASERTAKLIVSRTQN
jgi:lipid-A-disaccharide synthase